MKLRTFCASSALVLSLFPASPTYADSAVIASTEPVPVQPTPATSPQRPVITPPGAVVAPEKVQAENLAVTGTDIGALILIAGALTVAGYLFLRHRRKGMTW